MSDKTDRQLTEQFNQFFAGGHTNFRIPLQVTKNRLQYIEERIDRSVWSDDIHKIFALPIWLTIGRKLISSE